MTYYRMGKVDDAQRELDKAVEINPNDATWQSSLGKIYREKKEYGQAIPHLEKAVMLDPKDAASLSNLGVAYRQTNKVDEAREVFLEGDRAQARRQADTHFNLATVYRRKQKTQEAIAEYEKAIQLDSRLAPAHYDLGVLLAQLKRNDEAIKEWNTYIDLKGQQDPKEVDVVRKHVKELGGTPH